MHAITKLLSASGADTGYQLSIGLIRIHITPLVEVLCLFSFQHFCMFTEENKTFVIFLSVVENFKC